MTSKERVLTALRNEQPDRVPVVPDLYEMVPVRLSGRPSWESLLFEDPPVWKLRTDAYRHFGVDGLFILPVPLEGDPMPVIVHRSEDKLITRHCWEQDGRRVWSDVAIVYVPNDATGIVKAATIGLPAEHDSFEVIHKAYNKTGLDWFDDARAYLGDGGVCGPCISLPSLGHWVEDTYAWCEDPDSVVARMEAAGAYVMDRLETYLSWNPEVVFIGNSGMMLFNPEPVFRQLSLGWLQKITKRCKEAGVLTHLHCCGPERKLVEIAANESDLDGIEPLEPEPMGDCDLADLKKSFGKKIALKGNLHTTSVMLHGTPEQVREASKKAIDDAGEGGGFILSTGDQTPRDTPEANIAAMIEAAETYGRYG